MLDDHENDLDTDYDRNSHFEEPPPHFCRRVHHVRPRLSESELHDLFDTASSLRSPKLAQLLVRMLWQEVERQHGDDDAGPGVTLRDWSDDDVADAIAKLIPIIGAYRDGRREFVNRVVSLVFSDAAARLRRHP